MLEQIELKQFDKCELLLLRDKNIIKDFLHHTKTKHLSSDYVIHDILQTKYFLTASSIWLIVRGNYKRKYHKIAVQ